VPAEVLAAGHDALALPAMEISATAIRAAVAARADISQLVPPGVARYIEINGLYLSEPGPDHRS
jgi:nicotinate-nucleotide adenylyltransferase